jgi:hypothetical protein
MGLVEGPCQYQGQSSRPSPCRPRTQVWSCGLSSRHRITIRLASIDPDSRSTPQIETPGLSYKPNCQVCPCPRGHLWIQVQGPGQMHIACINYGFRLPRTRLQAFPHRSGSTSMDQDSRTTSEGKSPEDFSAGSVWWSYSLCISLWLFVTSFEI